MRSSLIASFVVVCTCAALACGDGPAAPESRPDFPGMIRGIAFDRPPTAADSAAVAAFGRVVAVVRADSAILLETEADGSALRGIDGVARVGPALSESDTGRFELILGRRDSMTDEPLRVLRRLEAELLPRYRPVGPWVAGRVPAYRLGLLDRLIDPAEYGEVYLSIDPPRPAD